MRQLDQNFFLVRFDRLTPKEKEYLRAMAELGPGPRRGATDSTLTARQAAMSPGSLVSIPLRCATP